MRSLRQALSRTNRRLTKATDDIQALPKHTPLHRNKVDADGLVYEINDVYLEIGRGGNSFLRGFGALFIIPTCLAFLVGGPWAIWRGLSEFWEPTAIRFDPVTELNIETIEWFVLSFVPVGLFAIFLGLTFLSWSLSHFITVTDPIIRFDRKRQKVWMWAARGPIEIDWNHLTPRVRVATANAYGGKIMTAHYAELGPDGKPLKTRRIEHVLSIGPMMAPVTSSWEKSLELVTDGMEYVRRYMEEGRHAVPTPKKFLSHRVPWYAMFNFANVIDDWIDWHKAKQANHSAKRPPGLMSFTIVCLIFFPLIFLFHSTHWLALVVAPEPKWPKAILDMHAADLRELMPTARASHNYDLLAERGGSRSAKGQVS